MRVVTSPEASAFIESHGGVAYVRPLQRKCCGGALTVLAATTHVPADAGLYEPVGDPSLGVRYRKLPSARRDAVRTFEVEQTDPLGSPGRAEPHELLVELRGRHRPHLTACWDGCAYKM